MTKADILKALQGLDDETEVKIRFAWTTAEAPILAANYVPSEGDEYAHVAFVV